MQNTQSSNLKIPKQYLPLMPYLILKEAKAFSEFAKTVFGATEQMLVPTPDGQVMHGELRIFDAVVMFGQANDQWKEKTSGMFLYVDNVERVYNAALSKGAVSLTPPTKQEYGYSAGFEDPFGNQWWVCEGE